MNKSKQILFLTLTIVGDAVITFIIFFLLAIGFGTTESIRCKVGNDKSLEEVEKACRENIHYLDTMFMTEILIGLVIIAISNYFIYKALFKRPIIVTLIILTVYLITIAIAYTWLYQDFISTNLLRLTC